jgi:hypothetical protein
MVVSYINRPDIGGGEAALIQKNALQLLEYEKVLIQLKEAQNKLKRIPELESTLAQKLIDEKKKDDSIEALGIQLA